ncbi:AAR093Cp [Eremothecium gossypii ATCC 10895]|uniref:Glutamyl-tRNA(Gln) amidotransferase subunit F, mitochondrial n=1 Tax=Eremothecium gossypii (strain ATCC 10895 / CBS 109.51 / FGSC 9923 / NRRL Y-1056) TaxID=284811 RepID=GATF_EREGS|nr:AAR093Cp [Eremothecium gossypii ATCC 10895]Q75EI6.1 RecName: Full=Glutamyl-tRNA(Gln) amidotransferase subunit F, mitochondrial; Short=Glu-AdT subunit F [Eremothecium gossypii ATCC 10895]AAS50458.1 AAR093Cp [Eremothecium gossypii ATCC 10895]AEY94744.1 FAAR093Cp [Eremothecium gossypii FDAG1]
MPLARLVEGEKHDECTYVAASSLLIGRHKMLRSLIYASRRWSSSVGARFSSREELQAYLARPAWQPEDYLPSAEDIARQQLSEEETRKLLKLSGLPEADIQEVRRRLATQLSFVSQLQSVEVDDCADPQYAKAMQRHPAAIGYEELVRRAELDAKDTSLGEKSGSWDSTATATLKKDGYFVLREGLLQKR